MPTATVWSRFLILQVQAAFDFHRIVGAAVAVSAKRSIDKRIYVCMYLYARTAMHVFLFNHVNRRAEDCIRWQPINHLRTRAHAVRTRTLHDFTLSSATSAAIASVSLSAR